MWIDWLVHRVGTRRSTIRLYIAVKINRRMNPTPADMRTGLLDVSTALVSIVEISKRSCLLYSESSSLIHMSKGYTSRRS